MKKAWNIISNIAVFLIAVLAVCMMVFTIFSVNTFDRNDRSIFGYRLLVVLSDSMSATDFKAGDYVEIGHPGMIPDISHPRITGSSMRHLTEDEIDIVKSGF